MVTRFAMLRLAYFHIYTVGTIDTSANIALADPQSACHHAIYENWSAIQE